MMIEMNSTEKTFLHQTNYFSHINLIHTQKKIHSNINQYFEQNDRIV